MSKFIRPDFNIKRLAENSFRAIDEGAYECEEGSAHDPLSLRKAILSCPHAPLIAEVKFASPSRGKIRGRSAPAQLATAMIKSGAVALSVLTQPYVFDGSVEYLAAIRKAVAAPLLMKDIIVSRVQIDAARKSGADCVLFIKTIFDRNLAEESIENLTEYAAKRALSVIIEVHTDDEFAQVLRSKHGLIGINNRNLDNLQVDISNTERLLSKHGKGRSTIISESGITTPEDIRHLLTAGADAFLVGTSIMETADISAKVRELCDAI